jgi:peptidyl-prolyl cis-trans isomerase B (cyclophilin B)
MTVRGKGNRSAVPETGRAWQKAGLCLLLTAVLCGCGSGGPDREEQIAPEVLAAVLRAEDGRQVSETLGDLLSEGHRAEKARAVQALGRIGRAADIEVLAAFIHDPDPDIRKEAVFALGEIGTGLAGKRAAIGLKDSDPRVRGLAAEALSKCGEKDLADRILPLLDEEAPGARNRTLLACWRLASPQLLDKVLALADTGEPAGRWARAYCLRKLLENLPAEELTDPLPDRAESQLTRLAGDSDPRVRAEAAFGLCRLRSGTSGETLMPMLQDTYYEVKSAALQACRKRGATVPYVYFENLWNTPSSHMKVLILRILPRMEERWRGRFFLDACLQSRTDMVAETAWEILPYFEAGDYLNLVSQRLQDKTSWSYRSAAARGVAALKSGRSREFFFELASNEKDPKALWHMIDLLPGLEAPQKEAMDALRRESLAFALGMLKHADLAVRGTAVSTAAALMADIYRGEEQGESVNTIFSEIFRPAYFRSLDLKDPTPDVRIEILKALTLFPDLLAGREIVLSALKDPDYLVQKAALPLAESYFPDRPYAVEAEASPDRDDDFYLEAALMTEKSYRAYIKTHGGIIEIELFARDAPLTVKNFIELAKNKFYDGLTWHRVVPGFVIQGGCPRGDGWGGPGWTIRCEINQHRYETGAVGMALSGKDTGGSQFFIALGPQPHLDGGYTLFGRVVNGMDTVAQVDRGDMIESVRIVTAQKRPGP